MWCLYARRSAPAELRITSCCSGLTWIGQCHRFVEKYLCAVICSGPCIIPLRNREKGEKERETETENLKEGYVCVYGEGTLGYSQGVRVVHLTYTYFG